ncbi:ActS/PrrB/RegB family redox-sensitive histidine kinase [Denitrobaculum tricleocarpae]|uniref:histidine kinase n=1 Tax=Denitrobaculum tricleocarpae TaxID=2591009 RepID=A0A545TGH7_9PROT|nr:ActS/PrrB/RegB family redox-sensitive histidine kinase [Denitrobaculum tricleocarpae]TQV76323.1 ActS/PrrB/RegB family redox-sensitive histidine kinase [Denitrobaculum tricleocarpae]
MSRLLTSIFPSIESGQSGKVRLRTLVVIRWIALVGQLGALAIIYFGFDFELPVLAALLVVAASGLLNVVQSATRRADPWLSDRDAALTLGFDLLQLAVLLGLTGGLSNPFAILILAPVTVSASNLSRRSTLLLSILAVAAVSTLAFWHYPLPWTAVGFALPPLYVGGAWAALVVAALFIAAYVSSIAAESRDMSDALTATQMALAREQRLSALGGLAAAAAHELGSPLATIAVVARELNRDLPEDSPGREDVELLLSESNRCGEILADLAAWSEEEDDDFFNRLPLEVLVEASAAPYERDGVEFDIAMTCLFDEEGTQPIVFRSPEILHGLGLLIQNAMQFAEKRVEARLDWNEETVSVVIIDDGPGFDPAIMGRLGQPYLYAKEPLAKEILTGETGRGGEVRQKSFGRSRPAATAGRAKNVPAGRQGGHMGLGVFIAKTLLGRTGATVSFDNGQWGGAEVEIVWPREAMETEFPAKGTI